MTLPTPYYEEPENGITLYCGDCRDIIPQLPKVDLVLTDPPYGFNRFETDGKDFIQLIQTSFEQLLRTMNTGAWAFVFSGTGAIKEIINAIPLGFQRLLTLYKPADCTYPYRGWLLTSEAILLFSNGEPKPLNDRKPYKHDCYIHNHVGQEGVEGHPTVKPLNVILDLARRANDTDLILDPFCGSGTTLVAAKKLGRRAIGIEIEPKYCEITKQRLRQDYLDL